MLKLNDLRIGTSVLSAGEGIISAIKQKAFAAVNVAGTSSTDGKIQAIRDYGHITIVMCRAIRSAILCKNTTRGERIKEF